MTGRFIQHERLLNPDTSLANSMLVPRRVIGGSRTGRHSEFVVDEVPTFDTAELEMLIA